MLMKTVIALALLGLAVAKVDYSGYRVFRAYPTLKQFETIKTMKEKYDLDFWSDLRYEGDFVDFMVRPTFRSLVEETLNFFKITYETFIEDVEIAARAQFTPGAEWNIATDDAFYDQYHTLDEINQWIDVFATTNSAVASQLVIGTSYEGRSIGAIKIGTGDQSFVINCGIHSREWVSPATCMLTAKWLAESTDSAIVDLRNQLTFYIIPSANPDGYVYTWTTDRMWRKTRKPITKVCTGVDPNRNFDANWGGEGASGNACTDTYYGPSVFSEVETQAQRDFVASLGNVKAYIDIHAYSQMWMYPYGYTYDSCADATTLDKIASDSVAAIRSVHGKSYEAGSISGVIYVASGSTADYFYDKQNVKCSFAAELRDKGLYGFTLPDRQIRPTAEETVEGLKVIANAIVAGECG